MLWGGEDSGEMMESREGNSREITGSREENFEEVIGYREWRVGSED